VLADKKYIEEVEEEPEYENAAGQDSISRMDRPRKKKKKKHGHRDHRNQQQAKGPQQQPQQQQKSQPQKGQHKKGSNKKASSKEVRNSGDNSQISRNNFSIGYEIPEDFHCSNIPHCWRFWPW
jgi:hypothetical protein